MTPEETIFEKAQWWKAGMLSGSDASLKAVIGYEMKVAIEAAILAEREACAKIADDQLALVVKSSNDALLAGEIGLGAERTYAAGLIFPIAINIRARSNALETPNKPLDSSENLQSYTFPASTLKTCP